MKSLVLGAGGFLGKNLCLYLSSKGVSVRAFDLSEMQDLRNHEGIECVQGDFLMLDTMPELFDGVDRVYHLICTTVPKVGTKQIPKELELNLIPLTNLLEILIERNIDKFVFVSSAGTIYGNTDVHNRTDQQAAPISSYGALKEVSESYINLYNRIYNKKYRIARLSNPYGTGQGEYKMQGIIPIYINHLISNKSITVFGDGDNVRDYIYIDDAIRALDILGDYAGDTTTFNIGSGNGYSINEIIEMIERTSGRKFVEIDRTDRRACDVGHNELDITDSIQKLDWNPQISLEEGIDLTYRRLIK